MAPFPAAVAAYGKPGGGDWAGGIIATPIVHDGFIYSVTEGGLLIVYDLKAKQEAYRKQLEARTRFAYVSRPGFVSSPSIAGKYLYLMDDYCTTFIVELGPKYKLVGKNDLQDLNPNWNDTVNQQATMSTPIFDENRMYVRTSSGFWCIGDK